MSSQPWERALERYANSLYRLALLREPIPARAARATAAAFERIDWSSATLDDQLEARLVAALPPLRRRFRPRLQRRRLPPPLPPSFWRLAPDARLALGMRLGRGHNSAQIALALNRPPDDVRLMLCDTVARLAGDDPASIDALCRHSRALRMDEAGAERMHVLGCEACRAALPRWEAAEQALGQTLGRATGTLSLPRETEEAIALHLRSTATPAQSAQNPLLLRTASVVLAVLVILGLLIMPHDRRPTAARPPATARTVIQQALAGYGAPPAGSGVLHQRITVVTDVPRIKYEAEVWTDAAQPARHRMQLMEGRTLREWQSGDGARSWRYMSQLDHQYCGLSAYAFDSTASRISRWMLSGDEQASLRAARWTTGPWALGRQLLEQAAAAATVRSLGTVADNETTILTLAAEGGSISGTLLLRFDAATAGLREIRQLTVSNGQTRSETRWKIESEERIASDAAMRTSLFSIYPARQQPHEINRSDTILDPVCPLLELNHTTSVGSVLSQGWPQLIGFASLPPGLEQAYLVGPPGADRDNDLMLYDPGSLALVYIGTGKRLVLHPQPIFLRPDDIAPPIAEHDVATGEWLVAFDARDTEPLTGLIAPRPTSTQETTPVLVGLSQQWDFLAEGWTRDELIEVLGTLHTLSLNDWAEQYATFIDPSPLDPQVLDIVLTAARQLKPVEHQIEHVLAEREVRQQPQLVGLEDPYHMRPTDGRTETWLGYGANGRPEKYRAEHWQSNQRRTSIVWGDDQQMQNYDVRSNIVRELPAGNLGAYSGSWQIEDALRPVLRYEGFTVTARDNTTVTVAATMPIAATEYQWLLEVQQPPDEYWSDWSKTIDVSPETVTFSLGFDIATGMLQTFIVTTPGPNGPITLQRTTILEVDNQPPADGWEYVPPAGTTRLKAASAADLANAPGRPRLGVSRMSDILVAAPSALWGWPDGHALRFLNADVPTVTRPSSLGYQSIDSAIMEGVAVELHYQHANGEAVDMLEGPADLLQLMLQQTSPAWTSSLQRTIAIAGRRRPVWLMSNDRQHWAIFQLEQTLVMLTYTGDQFDTDVLPVLAELEPLE